MSWESEWYPRYKTIPHNVLTETFRKLEAQDSPEDPGLVSVSSLRSALDRFRSKFGIKEDNEVVDRTISMLQRESRPFMSSKNVETSLIEWDRPEVYSLFKAELNLSERIYYLFDFSDVSSYASRFISLFLASCIVLSVTCWVLSTVPSLQRIPNGCTSIERDHCEPLELNVFESVEWFCLLVFTAEYICRLLSVHSVRMELLNTDTLSIFLASPHEKIVGQKEPKLKNIFNFIISPFNLIDLLSFLPSWVELFLDDTHSPALAIMRLLRATRVLRVFKLLEYNSVSRLFARVMLRSGSALSVIFIFTLLSMVFFGTGLWFFEQGDWFPQGNDFLTKIGIKERGAYLRLEPDGVTWTLSPFASIPDAFWWVVVTVTTVGYGDMVPVTAGGKIIGMITMLAGVLIIATPIGIIGSNFSFEWTKFQENKRRAERTLAIAQKREARKAKLNQLKSSSRSRSLHGLSHRLTRSDEQTDLEASPRPSSDHSSEIYRFDEGVRSAEKLALEFEHQLTEVSGFSGAAAVACNAQVKSIINAISSGRQLHPKTIDSFITDCLALLRLFSQDFYGDTVKEATTESIGSEEAIALRRKLLVLCTKLLDVISSAHEQVEPNSAPTPISPLIAARGIVRPGIRSIMQETTDNAT